MVTTSKVNHYTMKTLTLPQVGTVFTRDKIPEARRLNPYVTGEGPLTYTCGSCGLPILKTIGSGQVTAVIYKCPKCGSYNQIDAADKKQ